MRGIASDMDLSQFLIRLVNHVTAAASVLIIVLAVGEYFVPGTVLPFIDLVDAIPALVVLLAFSLILAKKQAE